MHISSIHDGPLFTSEDLEIVYFDCQVSLSQLTASELRFWRRGTPGQERSDIITLMRENWPPAAVHYREMVLL